MALSQPADPPCKKREGGAVLSYVRLGGAVRMTSVTHTWTGLSCLLCLKKKRCQPPTPRPLLFLGSEREQDRSSWHWASAICQMSVLLCSDLQTANDGSVRRCCEAAARIKHSRPGLRTRQMSKVTQRASTFSGLWPPAQISIRPHLGPLSDPLRGPAANLPGKPTCSLFKLPRVPCTQMTSPIPRRDARGFSEWHIVTVAL